LTVGQLRHCGVKFAAFKIPNTLHSSLRFFYKGHLKFSVC